MVTAREREQRVEVALIVARVTEVRARMAASSIGDQLVRLATKRDFGRRLHTRIDSLERTIRRLAWTPCSDGHEATMRPQRIAASAKNRLHLDRLICRVILVCAASIHMRTAITPRLSRGCSALRARAALTREGEILRECNIHSWAGP